MAHQASTLRTPVTTVRGSVPHSASLVRQDGPYRRCSSGFRLSSRIRLSVSESGPGGPSRFGCDPPAQRRAYLLISGRVPAARPGGAVAGFAAVEQPFEEVLGIQGLADPEGQAGGLVAELFRSSPRRLTLSLMPRRASQPDSPTGCFQRIPASLRSLRRHRSASAGWPAHPGHGARTQARPAISSALRRWRVGGGQNYRPPGGECQDRWC